MSFKFLSGENLNRTSKPLKIGDKVYRSRVEAIKQTGIKADELQRAIRAGVTKDGLKVENVK